MLALLLGLSWSVQAVSVHWSQMKQSTCLVLNITCTASLALKMLGKKEKESASSASHFMFHWQPKLLYHLNWGNSTAILRLETALSIQVLILFSCCCFQEEAGRLRSSPTELPRLLHGICDWDLLFNSWCSETNQVLCQGVDEGCLQHGRWVQGALSSWRE